MRSRGRGGGLRARRVGRAGVGLAALALGAGALLAACSSTPTSASTSGNAKSKAKVEGGKVDKLPTVPRPTTTTTAPDLSTAAGQKTFLNQVFADVQAVWNQEFSSAGLRYVPATLDIFHTKVRTACGTERADVGPFYCSADRTVYLDIQFFSAMKKQFGLTGDFAEAYVVAHEMGHHIQNLIGVTARAAATEQAVPALANALSVDVELQADCLAGVWAHTTYTRKLLEPGDIQEALQAAQIVGDDFLAHASGATVSPDSWTHGSSAQRTKWFTTGYESGSPNACDTFSAGASASTPTATATGATTGT